MSGTENWLDNTCFINTIYNMKGNQKLVSSFENEELFLNTIKYLSDVIDSRDAYTLGHSERVRRYSMRIGKMLELSNNKMDTLYLASILHDIGKVKVPINILKSGKKLNRYEFAEMKRHSVYGAYLLGSFKYVKGIQETIRHHHERYDGKGYPDGLKKKKIPLFSRIIAVCDAFDAMTSDRNYIKEMRSEEYAIKELKKHSGTQFDPEIADIFLKLYKRGYIHLEKGLHFVEQREYVSIELAEFLLKKAISKLKNKEDKALAKYNCGKIYLRNSEYKKALNIFKDFLNYAKNDDIKAEVFNYIASASYHMGDLTSTLKYTDKVINMKNVFLEKARTYRYIAKVLFDKGESPDKIVNTLNKSRDMHDILERRIEKQKSTIMSKQFSVTKYNHLINLSKKIQVDNAKHFDVIAFVMYNLANFDEANYFYSKSINLKHFNGDFYGSVRSQSGIALLHMDMNRFKDAEFNLLEATNLAHRIDDRVGLRMVYNNLGLLYSYWKKEEKAIYYYKKAFELAIKFNKQSYASESCAYLIEKAKSKKTKDNYKKKYLSLHSNNNSLISDYIIINNGKIEYETLKQLHFKNIEILKKKHRILQYAKLYYKFMKLLKAHNDSDYDKYIEKIPDIISQLSNSVIKKRLVKIYDINTKISRNNRP